jgi:hypothetical protein
VPYVIKIEGMVTGGRTPFDDEYIVEYDPERDGTDPLGHSMRCHLLTTPDVHEARQFGTPAEAFETWRKVCQRQPERPDGKPNRPLTAFTVTVVKSGRPQYRVLLHGHRRQKRRPQ